MPESWYYMCMINDEFLEEEFEGIFQHQGKDFLQVVLNGCLLDDDMFFFMAEDCFRRGAYDSTSLLDALITKGRESDFDTVDREICCILMKDIAKYVRRYLLTFSYLITVEDSIFLKNSRQLMEYELDDLQDCVEVNELTNKDIATNQEHLVTVYSIKPEKLCGGNFITGSVILEEIVSDMVAY